MGRARNDQDIDLSTRSPGIHDYFHVMKEVHLKRWSPLFYIPLVLFCFLLAGCGGSDSGGITKTTSVPQATGTNTVTPLLATSVGLSYSTAISVGGTPPFTFVVSSGSLPPGLNASSSGSGGAIAGTPTTAGDFTFAITVGDSSTPPASATNWFSIHVAPVPGGTSSGT
jgi:hypothetical protein